MKNLRGRISMLLMAVLIIGLIPLGSAEVYAQGSLQKTSVVDQLNGQLLDESIDKNEAFRIGEEIRNMDLSQAEKTAVRRIALTEEDATEENQSTPVISFGQIVQNQITTPGSLKVYLLEQQVAGKITVYMDVPNDNGINYDLYLYKYNLQTGNLELVDGSVNAAGNYEQLSAICEPGVYVVGVILKDLSTQPKDYAFVAVHSPTYSSNEPNDKINQAKGYTVGTVVKDSIDNPFDQDHYVTRVTTEAAYQVMLRNVPENGEYHVGIYDSSLNFVSGKKVTKKDSNFNAGVLPEGLYLIKIATIDGFDATQEYEFQLYKKTIPNSKFLATRSGQFAELTPNALYINGEKANMDWSYYYNINYTRNQEVRTNPETSFDLAVFENGTYSGPQGVSSDDCIRVQMTRFSYMYFYKQLISGGQYDYLFITPSEMAGLGFHNFYVDAKTGKAIDTYWNAYSLSMGMPQKFSEFK